MCGLFHALRRCVPRTTPRHRAACERRDTFSAGVRGRPVVVEGVDRLTTALRASVVGLDGPRAIEAIVTELLSQVRIHPDFAKLVVAEVFRTGRDWQHSIRQVREESMAVFADVVRATWPGCSPEADASHAARGPRT
jgi:hypothetical protein